jgi:putative (di)nucleoside polyphosphate hydrolase
LIARSTSRPGAIAAGRRQDYWPGEPLNKPPVTMSAARVRAVGSSRPADVEQWPQGARMTDFIDSQGFRANVGIVLMNDRSQVFLGGRTGGRGWQFPQGGIRQGEELLDALYRELGEEVGLAREDVTLLGSTGGWLRYRLPGRYVRRGTSPVCIGQKQRWFLLRVERDDDRFRFDTTDQPEFERWRWVDYWTPVREVIYFKRRVYARALHELGAHAFPQGLPPYPDWWGEHGKGGAGAQADATGAMGSGA